MTSISVIIPTHNRSTVLRTTLESAVGLQYPREDFEILVVDNASRDDTAAVVRAFQQPGQPAVQYVREERLGLHFARHAGARSAKGDLLLFTDDDATFSPGWLRAYAEAYAAHPEMAAAGGPIRPLWESPPPPWLLEYMQTTGTNHDPRMFGFLSLMEPFDDFQLGPECYFFGVNMSIYRHILFEVGGFNPESFGDFWLGDGETGLLRKLTERELPVGYVPEALVYHRIPPQRMTVKYLCGRLANEGACEAYADFHHGIPSRLRLGKHALAITVKNLKRWLAARRCRGQTDLASLNLQVDAARTRSRLRYVLRMLVNSRLRELILKEDWLNEP